MNILVACEESQRVASEFRSLGQNFYMKRGVMYDT